MADKFVILNGERHVVSQCISCAVWHTVPEIVHEHHREHGGFHHCPNGHQYGWRKGEEQRREEEVRRERDLLKQDAARLEGELAAQRKRAEDAERAALQTKRRAAAGVCPCCNRTFLNVQRHMKTKHANVIPLEQKSA